MTRSGGAAALLSCLAYSVCSVSMVLVNKSLLSGWGFGFPVALLIAQNAIGVLCLLLAGATGLVAHEAISARSALRCLPINVFFTLMLFSSFHSLSLLSVPMATIFKNCTNLLIVWGDWRWFGQRVSPLVLLSLGIMLAGAVMSAKHDLAFSLQGYLWMCLNCVATAAYVLYMRGAGGMTGLSRFGLVLHNNALSLPLLLAVAAVEGETAAVAAAPQLLDSRFVGLVALSGGIGFALSLSSFWCVSVTSATTYAIVGSLNKVPVTLLGFLVFAVPVTTGGAFYIAVSVAGGMLYSAAKLQERREAAQAADGKI